MSFHCRIVRRLIACCLIIGFTGVKACLVAESGSVFADEPKWPITAAGIFESVDQSEFKCEFNYQRGVAMSAADAEQARFVNSDGESTKGDMATGLLVKRKNFTRYRLMYDTPTGFRVKGKTGFSLASMDTAGGQSVLVMYYPKQRNTDEVNVGGDGSVLREDRAKTWHDIRMFTRTS